VAVPDVFASFEVFVKEPRHDDNRVNCDVGNKFELEMDERTRKMLSEIEIWFQTHAPDINRSSLGAYAKSMCEKKATTINRLKLFLSQQVDALGYLRKELLFSELDAADVVAAFESDSWQAEASVVAVDRKDNEHNECGIDKGLF
jgi:hypothetical protein